MPTRDARDYRPIPAGAIKIDLPNATQVEDYTCGPSCLLVIASYFGVGPEHEWDFEADMMMSKGGADPIHITTAAERYGLQVQEYRPMRDADLVACLDRGQPVIIMLQAWAKQRPASYANEWGEGHYVVAIGYDDVVFYFEDPVLHGSRGYVPRSELAERWHDIEGDPPAQLRTPQLGIAIWRDEATPLAYRRAARRID